MKILAIIILALSINKGFIDNKDFSCWIKSSKEVYKMGETPKISVSITNNSGEDVYLIGSLDGSEEKWRSPLCYFKIEKPETDIVTDVERCGNVNPLKKQDFKLIKAGESFNPYKSVDEYGFFSSYQISRQENFRIPGKYKLTFYYSTISTKIEDYLGDGDENKKLQKLFSNVPHIQIGSNTIEIEIVK